MTIHPDSAEWVAVLRYDVIGGALDAIHLKMPAAWAADADLRLLESELPIDAGRRRGPDAFWTITPARPIWGSQTVCASSDPCSGRRSRDRLPGNLAAGTGGVDAYLSVINATGRPLAIENTVGLQPIPFASRFQAGEFARRAGTAVAHFG